MVLRDPAQMMNNPQMMQQAGCLSRDLASLLSKNCAEPVSGTADDARSQHDVSGLQTAQNMCAYMMQPLLPHETSSVRWYG